MSNRDQYHFDNGIFAIVLYICLIRVLIMCTQFSYDETYHLTAGDNFIKDGWQLLQDIFILTRIGCIDNNGFLNMQINRKYFRI